MNFSFVNYWSYLQLRKIDSRDLASIKKLLDHSLKPIIKSVEIQNGAYWPEDTTFNERWNERYGNALGTLSLAGFLGYEGCVDRAIPALINRLLMFKYWNVKGHEGDDVNVLHLVLGCFYGNELLVKNGRYDYQEKLLDKFEMLLRKSLACNHSNWYVDKVVLHNHCFHILLLRFVLIIFLARSGRVLEKIDLNAIMKKTKERFDLNLSLLDNEVVEGATYEGPSYTAYSCFSIMQFYSFRNLFFNDFLEGGNEWIENFNNFIRACYVKDAHVSYAVGDSPYNWSYGPEYQIAFFGWSSKNPAEGINFARELLSRRLSLLGDKKLTRNNDSFLNLFYLGFSRESHVSAVDHNSEISTAITPFKVEKYEDVGITTLRSEDYGLRVFMRHGIHGGRVLNTYSSKNVGHSYPSIGDVAVFFREVPVLFGGLYSKPKKNDFWSTFSFRSNDSIFYQDGIGAFLVDGKESSKMPNYLQNGNYAYSPSCFYQVNSKLILILIINKAYKYCDVNLVRLVIAHDELGVVIADSFHIKNPNIFEIESNYVNSIDEIGRITSVTQDGFILSKDPNILITARFPHLKHVYSSEASSYCHEFAYKISSIKVKHSVIDGFGCGEFSIIKNLAKDNISMPVSSPFVEWKTGEWTAKVDIPIFDAKFSIKVVESESGEDGNPHLVVFDF